MKPVNLEQRNVKTAAVGKPMAGSLCVRTMHRWTFPPFKIPVLLFLFIIVMTGCSYSFEQKRKKMELLRLKAAALDSVIQAEAQRIHSLDSMIKKEEQRVFALDSMIMREANRIDTLVQSVFKKIERAGKITE